MGGGRFLCFAKTTMPASLTECGFMDSATDIKYILNSEWSKTIALGIAEGICEVFGGVVKSNKDENVKVMSAERYNESLGGVYSSTVANLKLRAGANSSYSER